MGAMIFAIPAMLIAIAGIFFYVSFAVLFGTFAAMQTARRVAPGKIGITLGAGFVTLVVSKSMFGTGGSGLESATLFLGALFLASLVMLALALIFAATSPKNPPEMTFKDQDIVDNEIKADLETGGWGLRKSCVDDSCIARRF